MKLTEELLERKFPARDKSRLAAPRATTRSDDHDNDSTSTSSEVAADAARNSLISSSKCVSSEIFRTRSVQSFLNDTPSFVPPTAMPAAVTSLTSSSTSKTSPDITSISSRATHVTTPPSQSLRALIFLCVYLIIIIIHLHLVFVILKG